MNNDSLLLLGFNVLANNTITVSGFATVDCIFDNTEFAHDKQMTFTEDFDIPVIVKTSDLPAHPKSVIGKYATLNGEVYRIDRLRFGGATTFLYLNSKEKA